MHTDMFSFFFFNDTATTEIYTLSLHDALPISTAGHPEREGGAARPSALHRLPPQLPLLRGGAAADAHRRSEEHTSELQSRQYLVCRLLLEKKTQTLNSSRAQPETTTGLYSIRS